jgi:dTDP-4-amino-4,6-dideoxygalactose transaminase
LIANGIGANLHYIPVHRQPFYEAMGFIVGYCPEAELYHQETISLPIFSEMTSEQQQIVSNSLRNIFSE